ncbi:MAG: efflux RND transporter periplasmic adaptor subunit [Myxococcota bacterium]
MDVRRIFGGPIRSKRAARSMFILLIATGLGACGGVDEPTLSAESLRPSVMVERAVRQDVFDRISATGQLIAKAEATVAAQVSGTVTEIRALEGESVEASGILLVIDPERRQLEVARSEAQLAKAQAELAVAARNFKRTTRLSNNNVASEARLDEDRTRESMARSVLSDAQAQLGLARRALADATVRAPFAGMIARRHVNVGEYLSVGSPLFDLVALDPIEVEFTLAEIDSSKVALGFPVEITLAPYPDEVFLAKVSMISPTMDPRTRTLRVKAELPNPDGRIRPGLFAHAYLGVSERLGAVVVPEEAVVQRADGPIVFRLGKQVDRVERIQVETRAHGDGWIEIVSGLQANDRLVVRGHLRLENGVLVSVRNFDGSLATQPAAIPAQTSERIADAAGHEEAR